MKLALSMAFNFASKPKHIPKEEIYTRVETAPDEIQEDDAEEIR